MTRNESCLYNSNHLIPVHEANNYMEERHLSISIHIVNDKMHLKIKDLSQSSFNYTLKVDVSSFEEMRLRQCLDINYTEFKTNLVDMLNQNHKNEMLMRCQLSNNVCTLIFYTKTKIKSIVYLTLDLQLTDPKEIVEEMYCEVVRQQNINKKLEAELCNSRRAVQAKEFEIQDLEKSAQFVLEQFGKNLRQIDRLFATKLADLETQIASRLSKLKTKIQNFQKKIEILNRENQLKLISGNRLMETMENLRLENIESSKSIQDLRRENASLNVLRVTLERNVADLKKSLEDFQNDSYNVNKKKSELEQDLERLSIAVTQKDAKISELSKDLVQANNMLVQFNNHYDAKVQQMEQLQETLQIKERQIEEQKYQTNQALRTFQDYKLNFNSEKFESMQQEIFASKERIHELSEEARKLNKMNAILTQKLGHHYLTPK